MANNKTKLIFITGGVVSSLGKGIVAASLATLLQSRGYKVTIRKLDPYLNVDPGTMNPLQHGEVFVTHDGAETDLDLGHYERFTGIDAKRRDNTTTGQIYSTLLKRERDGEYLGCTVQVIPHITDIIKEFITSDINDIDFLLCEIGGTVGDIEGLPYFEAIRQIGYELSNNNVIYIHLTLVPYLNVAEELKTKPTQHSVKELRSIGIQPNILVCRTDRKIPVAEMEKIALFANLSSNNVIQALDCNNLYEVPIVYHQFGLDKAVLRIFGMLDAAPSPNLDVWYDIVDRFTNYKHKVTIGLIGKYNHLKDAYKSLLQAFEHAGIAHRCRVEIKWIDTEDINSEHALELLIKTLGDVDGIVIPGGFGSRGIESKILAIKYAREHDVPFLGICLGMQLTLVEYARNVIGIKDANSTEFDEKCTPIVCALDNLYTRNKAQEHNTMHIKMRLGAHECTLAPNSKAYVLYGNATTISERHRHRYGFNIKYKSIFNAHGMKFSGMSSNGDLVEIIELPNAKFFIATQFHPEFKSKPTTPHPVFLAFIQAAMRHSNITTS